MNSARAIRHATLTPLATLVACLLLAANASALPPGRHYEMVSEPYKAGYGVNDIWAVEPDGEAMIYQSYGAFAGTPADHIGAGFGNHYLARRDASGWSTSPLEPPASILPYTAPGLADLSSNFSGSVFVGKSAPNTGAGQHASTEYDVYVHPTLEPDLSEYFTPVRAVTVPAQRIPSYTSASADLSQVVIESFKEAPLTPEAVGTTMENAQYVLSVKNGGLSFLALNNASPHPTPINPSCNVQLGSGLLGGQSVGLGPSDTSTNTISADGSEIFFHTCVGPDESKEQLFVRLNGERTLEVSRPLKTSEPCVGESNGVSGEVPCRGAAVRDPAEFDGASEDGSKVFFTTRAPLLGEETHGDLDFYMARIGCPGGNPACEIAQREVTALARITRPLNSSETGGMQGVVSQSLDGSHLYFVARGVLSGVNAEGRAPIAGADNLYVYNSDAETVTFIADLCSAAGVSGEHQDQQCPGDLNETHGATKYVNDARDLWEDSQVEAQTADDGRFLLFSSYAQLTNDDTDDAKDIFRYDARTGTIVRISVGERGYHANGNGDNEANHENPKATEGNADASIPISYISESSPRRQAELNSRAISEDGSRIVFATEEPLSQAATNGLLNGYEWYEGRVSLVSSGSDEQAVGQAERMTITASGSDIFFMTTQKLLGQDSDEVADIYDARLWEGFPVPAGGTERCKGEACQGALTAPAPALVPAGTARQTAEEAVPAPSTKVTSRKKAKSSRSAGKRKRGHHRKQSSHTRSGARKRNVRGAR